MIKQQGMRNLVFEVQEIIDNKDQLDVWIIYHTEKNIEHFHSLQSCLWSISFPE